MYNVMSDFSGARRISEGRVKVQIPNDKVRRYEMMMNTVCNSIYYLLYIYPNMYK